MDILTRFPIGAVSTCRPLGHGLIHQTHLVEASAGRFVLQRLHPKLSTQAILDDYAAVTAHLAARGARAPRLVRTVDGRTHAVDTTGRWWRLAVYAPGQIHERINSADDAEQAARGLGRFHRLMEGLTYRFQSTHPLHDTAGHLAALRASVANAQHTEALALIHNEIDTIERLLPPLMLPDDLPQRVVHGDPKVSNVLFDGPHAVGMIDLDTCNRHSVLVDLGDAVRSWCRDGGEDETQHFHVDRFEAMLKGYAAEGLTLTAAERAHLPGAGRLITLELAARFARDVLEDEYFAFDATRYTSRRAHNLARTRGMLFLANDIERHADRLKVLVERWLPT